MHLLLTDRLTCPRCGPAFGLILRADELTDRRVASGVLGCPNCRESYPIAAGEGDLRPGPRTPLNPVPPVPPASDEEVDTVQALLGLGGEIGLSPGVAQTVLVGRAARYAAGLGSRLPDLEMVTVSRERRSVPEGEPVTALVTGGVIPLHEATVRGVVLEGKDAEDWIASAARVVAPLNRVVVMAPSEEAADLLERGGLQVQLRAPEAVVARRNPGSPTVSPGVAPLSGPR